MIEAEWYTIPMYDLDLKRVELKLRRDHIYTRMVPDGRSTVVIIEGRRVSS